MIPRLTRSLALALIAAAAAAFAAPARAQWTWSPETGWVNRRYVGTETPKQLETRAKKETAAKQHKQAAKTRTKIADKFPGSQGAQKALFDAAESAYKAGEFLEADALYVKYSQRFPRDARHAKVVARRYDIGRALVLGTHKPGGLKGLSAKERGEQILRSLILDYPLDKQEKIAPDEMVDDAIFVLGQYYLREKQYDEAITEYKRLRKMFPTSEWATQAQFQIGVAEREKSPGASYDDRSKQKAVEAFQRAGKKDPQGKTGRAAKAQVDKISETLAEKQLNIGRFYLKRGRKRAAKVYLRRTIAMYPGTRAAATARKELEELK